MASIAINIRDYKKEIPGKLSDDRIQWNFPDVTSINIHGKKLYWKIFIRLFTGAKTSPTFIAIDDRYFDSKPINPHINGFIDVASGQVGGKTKITVATIVKCGKNIGRSSATNVLTQALRDAYGRYNKQAKKSADGDNYANVELYPPMLARVYKDQKAKPIITDDHPVYVQRKYNGVRVVCALSAGAVELGIPTANGMANGMVTGMTTGTATGTVIMYSRRKKLYPGFDYIKKELTLAMQGYLKQGRRLYLDGEIYKHGADLQDISGAARRGDTNQDTTDKGTTDRDTIDKGTTDRDTTDNDLNISSISTTDDRIIDNGALALTMQTPAGIKYDYMIYDCFIPEEPNLLFSQRRAILNDFFDAHKFTYAKQVPTDTAVSAQDIEQFYAKYLAEGYEGAMVRINQPYKYSYNEYHSKVLLKMKPTLDHEFKVIGYTTGEKGKAADAVMIICETSTGIPFPCTPAMEIIDRIALAKKMGEIEANGKTHYENHFKGKYVQIFFDEWSRDRVPQRARTKMQIRTWD